MGIPNHQRRDDATKPAFYHIPIAHVSGGSAGKKTENGEAIQRWHLVGRHLVGRSPRDEHHPGKSGSLRNCSHNR